MNNRSEESSDKSRDFLEVANEIHRVGGLRGGDKVRQNSHSFRKLCNCYSEYKCILWTDVHICHRVEYQESRADVKNYFERGNSKIFKIVDILN